MRVCMSVYVCVYAGVYVCVCVCSTVPCVPCHRRKKLWYSRDRTTRRCWASRER